MQRIIKKVRKHHIISALAVGGLALAFLNGPSEPLFDFPDQFVLLAKEKINLGSDVTVSSGDVGVNDKKGMLEVGPQNILTSSLFASRMVLGPDSIVNGNAFFDKLTKTKDTQILGREEQTFQSPLVDFPEVADFPIDKGHLKTNPDVEATISPDDFGSITIPPDSKVIFEPGIYNIGTLTVGPNSTLRFLGTTTLNIKKNATIGNKVIFSPPNGLPLSAVRINSQGNELKIGNNSITSGIITAPNATLTLGSQTLHRGQLIAKHINIGRGAILSVDFTFSRPSRPEDLVIVGVIDFFVNVVEVNFTDEATIADAFNIADLLGAQIIGFGPINNLYALQISTRTVEELDAAIAQVEAPNDPKIEAVFRAVPFRIEVTP